MNEINIKINGVIQTLSFKESITLFDILEKYLKQNKNIAVALNFRLVSKSEWKKTKINDQDSIEVVSPFPGG
ncbi:sulfur carrier protein ThiS [Rickettsiales bacterium]|nr:sulfur carrier protein ThiS [Rickettsiales bacterium]